MKLNYQYAHHSHEESEDQFIQDSIEVLNAFDMFDWEEEAVKANKIQKCAPTLSFVNNESNELIWVSAFQDNSQLVFIFECHFPGEVSSWFGLFKKLGVVNLHFDGLSKSKARKVLEYFVNKEHDKLRELYA